MKEAEAQIATEKLTNLKSNFGVTIVPDWGLDQVSGMWQAGNWDGPDLDLLYSSVNLLLDSINGHDKFMQLFGGITVHRAELGTHGGTALAHNVNLAIGRSFSAWTVVHEFAHAWDANHGWGLSAKLEKYTGGYTSKLLSRLKRYFGEWDAGPDGKEDKPGRRGRKPGCNAAGYFYGDQPSGSDWNFDCREDFAESVAMYVALKSENALSAHARGRITRFELQNGEIDPVFRVADNWLDYKNYFYPDGGDYKITKRWKFVEELAQGKIEIP